MDAIGEAIGQALDTLFGTPLVGLVANLLGAYIVLLWLASALWTFVDMRRRTGTLVAAYGSAALVLLASPLLFPLALAVHRIARPHEFVSERRLADIREAALESEITAPRCPACRRVVEDDWLLCPDCRRPLGHRCRRCGRTAGLDWPVCAWCGSELEGDTSPLVRIRA